MTIQLAKVRRCVFKAEEKVNRMIRELTRFTGQRPTVVRIPVHDYLALTEGEKLNSFPGVEIKSALRGMI